jgi:hypothetical protein
MKRNFLFDLVSFSARITLGGLFVFASIDKISSPDAFTQSILNYKIISNPFVGGIIALILPWTELVAGCALILNVYRRGSAFIIAITQGTIRNLDISCGCFTQDPGATKIGVAKLLEDLFLLLLAICTILSPSPQWRWRR